MFLIKKLTFDQMNFLKLSVHVFCLAEKAKLRRTNSRTNCQQNKITVCHENVFCLVVQSVCCWGGGECNNQPLTGAMKVMDGRDKSNRTVAGKGQR